MTYTYTTEQYGRTEYKLDVERFTRDLCTAMGGTFEPETEEYDRRSRGRFVLGDVKIRVWRHKAEQVGLSIDATGIPRNLYQSFYGDKYKLPSITVSTSRPMATLVKDIRKRLIDAAATPLAARRELARQHQANKSNLAANVAAIKAMFPSLNIRADNRGTEASFYHDTPYVAGQIYCDGSVTIDRCASMPAETFARVLRILKGESNDH